MTLYPIIHAVLIKDMRTVLCISCAYIITNSIYFCRLVLSFLKTTSLRRREAAPVDQTLGLQLLPPNL